MNLSSEENRIPTAYHEAGHAVACYPDFEKAERVCNVRLYVSKEQAMALMMQPQNIAAVARVAGELLSRSTLESKEIEILIDVADGEATEQDYQRYLTMKRG